MFRRTALLLVPLTLTGCPIRNSRVQHLLEVDWYGEACSAAAVLGESASDARVVQAHAHQAPAFSMRVLPAESWGGSATAAGYGTDWAVFEATWDVRAVLAPELDGWVDLVEPGRDGPRQWTVCPPETCDTAWVRAHFAPLESSPQRDLWSTVGALAKVASVPFTLMIDLVTTSAQPQKAADGALGPAITFRTLESLGHKAPDVDATQLEPVWSAPLCSGAGACVRRWVATASDTQSQPAVAVRVAWKHESCEAEAAWRLNLPGGGALRERLAALGKVELADTPATAGLLHDP